jgi:hypothetical protein
MGTKVFCFSGSSYLRYDRGEDQVDENYPLPIDSHWPDFARFGFDSDIDAAVNWHNGKVYFFKKDRYISYDVNTNSVDPGFPLTISPHWPGFKEAGFDSGIDAAVNWANGKAFFFKGDRYLRYDIATNSIDPGYPLPIVPYWPGFKEAGFDSGIDAAVNWHNGKVFFFKGDRYLRYDIATDSIDPGYPLPIVPYWPGFKEAGFLERIRAAVDLSDFTREIWLPAATVKRASKLGPRYIPVPWRGVLHTTEGGTLEGAIESFKSTNYWPHFTIDPKTLRIVQHISLHIGSRALTDKVTPENAARCIQIEIVGFASQTPTWAPEQLAFISDVLRQIEDAVPIPRVSGRRFLDAAGVSATPRNRMSASEWKTFSGWCGHQHCPGETHWDPGAIDIDTLL